MATVTITSQSICSGGEHITLRRTISGNSLDFVFSMDELLTPITVEEQRVVVSVMTRFHFQIAGSNKAQAKAKLNSGLSVVTS